MKKQKPSEMNFVGMKFRAVVNGRRTLNGAECSATIYGEIERIDGDATLYEVVRKVVDYAEANNADMEYPEDMQVTLTANFEDDE
jgi:hypothetical protein